MLHSHALSLPPRKVDADKLSPFRFGALGDGVILTNDLGRWHHVDGATFDALLRGDVEPGHAAFGELAAKGFLREHTALDDIAAGVRARKRYVGLGPTVHRIHLSGPDGKLSVETAKDVLDLVMLSTAAALDLELVQGNGAYDADLLAFIVQYTTEKNRYEGKALTWRLVTSLGALPDGAATWLVDKRFKVRVALHGDAAQHDLLRGDGPDHATVTAHIDALHATAASRSRTDWRVEADVHVGQANVGNPDGLVAALVAAGVRTFRVHPQLEGPQAIDAAAWRSFYAGLSAAVVGAGKNGTALTEELGASVLARALRTDGTADPANRSPAGLGTGVLVYDAAGHVFPSERARALFADDDDLFLLGKAGALSYKECVGHSTLRTLAMASLLEGLPGFADHWTTPYCGVDPVTEYALTGDLFPKAPTSATAAISQGTCAALFHHLLHGDADTAAVLAAWGA